MDRSATVKPMRNPVRITGNAAGRSTCRNIWKLEAPMDRAAVT
jgi:hypothetical protein